MAQPTAARQSEAASDATTGLRALEDLARAARQVALYGLEHPIAAEAVEAACRVWAEETGGMPADVTAEENGLLWNGQALPRDSHPVSRFHAAMRERLIACIRVEPTVTYDELTALLLLLAQDPQSVLASGGAMSAFAGVARAIRVEDVDFTRNVRESETAWIEATLGVADDASSDPLSRIYESCMRTVRDLGDRETITRVRIPEYDDDAEPDLVEASPEVTSGRDRVAAQVAHIIQCAGEVALDAGEEYWQTWRIGMVAHLAALSPEWRAAIFRAPAKATQGHPDVLALLARDMSAEDCVSAILDHSNAILAERSRGLSRALLRIMPDAERKEVIEPLLHVEAVKRGMSEEIYRNVVGLLLSRAQRRAEQEKETARFSDEMMSMNESARSGMRDPELVTLLETTRPEAVRLARIQMLIELLDADPEMDQYTGMLQILTEEGVRSSNEGDTAVSLGVLTAMHRASSRDAEQDAGRRAVATTALARTGTAGVVAGVLSELARAEPDRRPQLLALLGSLGDEGMSALVSLARKPNSFDVTEVVTALLASDSDSSVWLRRLLDEATADAVPRIIPALTSAGDPRVTAHLAVLARHPSLSVRLELIRTIRERPGPGTGQLLIRFLEQQDPSVRMAAVRALGELRVRSAVPMLCLLCDRQSPFGEGARAKEAFIAALGAIGSEEAVPTLSAELLRGGVHGLLAGSRLKVAAAGALARIGSGAARNALGKGAHSLRRAVREACELALARLSMVGERPAEKDNAVG